MPSNSTANKLQKIPTVKASTYKKTAPTKVKTSSSKTYNAMKKHPRFNTDVMDAIMDIRPLNATKLYEEANEYSIDNHRAIGKVFNRYFSNPESKYNVTYLGNHTEIIKGKYISSEALEAERFKFSTNYYVDSYLQNDMNATPYENGRNVFIYARVSVKNDTSYSIAAQIQRTTEYVRDNLMNVTKIFVDDGKSARDMKNLNNELGFWVNDVYLPYISYFRECGDNLILVVDKVDRLSRNVAKGIEFIQSIISTGGEVHFVYENIVCKKSNWLSNTKYKVIEYLNKAEQESDAISERSRRSHEYRRNHKNDDDETTTDGDTEMTDSDQSYECSSTSDEHSYQSDTTTTDECDNSSCDDETSSRSTDSSSSSDPFASLVSALTNAVNDIAQIRKYYKKK